MKGRLRGLTPIGIGLVLIAVGWLYLHFSQTAAPPAMGTIQPPVSYLRSEGMRSARLFPGFKVLAVYIHRAPDYKRQKGGVSGTDSQVLAILGDRRGAVLAVTEAAGPPLDPGMDIANVVQGWSTVLPPSEHPVQRERLLALPRLEAFEVRVWLREAGLSRQSPVVWPFSGGAIVVVTKEGQSYARLFQSGGSTTVLGTVWHRFSGTSSTMIYLRPNP